ncbi:MAG TPA: Zn-dependent hydrolase, partial [Rhodospirillaceae bacterium]|nr:Zn-dependent hydrolase [Rhodospirillaceae bacterium]
MNLPKINSERLWQRHMIMAEIGATSAGGVDRQALTAEDIEAHRLLADWAVDLGFAVEIDAIGNMFIRRPGRVASAPPVAGGSHTDTQPKGGRFDGIFGVLAAFEVLQTAEEAGVETEVSLEAIAWNNEEGSRYGPACMGSAVHAGAAPLDEMLDLTDRNGVTLRACVEDLAAELPMAEERNLGAPLAAYIEPHIEQALELETNENVIGAVTGMQGYRRFKTTVIGDAAHSGTTPHARRRDAFLAAVDMARALRDATEDPADRVRFTIGKFEIPDSGLAIVPGRVEFVVDLRHPEKEMLTELGDQVAVICEQNKGPCEVACEEIAQQPPMTFDEAIVAGVERSAENRGFSHQRIYSS